MPCLSRSQTFPSASETNHLLYLGFQASPQRLIYMALGGCYSLVVNALARLEHIVVDQLATVVP